MWIAREPISGLVGFSLKAREDLLDEPLPTMDVATGFLVVGLALATRSYAGMGFIDFSTPTTVGSSVPSQGDLNPYGVAVVPTSVGNLVKGDVLVSNFNNSLNLQGTGSSIVQFSPAGLQTEFAEIQADSLPGSCPGGVGLTTALSVLRNGWVIVDSLPTTDGTSATTKAGCLIVLNASGKPVETFSGAPINGPWDMTADDDGVITTLYFTNVLNGTVAADTGGPTVNGNVVNGGTVVRMTLFTPPQGLGVPLVLRTTIIGSGFAERTDPAALVIGPTGVGLSKEGTLYVADTQNSRIAAIPNATVRVKSAGPGTTVSQGGALNGPLGLAIAPNGDILTVNGLDGNLVETTPGGVQTATNLSPVGAGVLFGLAVVPGSDGIYFVNDGDNTLDLAE